MTGQIAADPALYADRRVVEQAASKASGPSAVVVTAGVLVIAVGIGVALHFFGDRLL